MSRIKDQIKKVAMIGGTFSVALGIGFVMQNGDVLASRFGGEDELRAAQAQVQSQRSTQSETTEFIVLDALPRDEVSPGAPGTAVAGVAPEASLTLPDLIQPATSALVGLLPAAAFDAPSVAMPLLQLVAVDPDQLPLSPYVGGGSGLPSVTDCAPGFQAEPQPAAVVVLTLSAPCNPDTRVTIHHQGMMFTEVTDTDGMLEVMVPALAETAVFLADVSGGEGAMVMAEVPEVALYDRAVLQWQGDAGFELHAREFGAPYGANGHVWNGATGDYAAADTAGSGFLVQLGARDTEQALMAEVYTYPTGAAPRGGDVALSAEIAITAENCGRDIAAQSMQIGPGRETAALDLTLVLPGCDAEGDFLVLHNMFEDLRLAAVQ